MIDYSMIEYNNWCQREMVKSWATYLQTSNLIKHSISMHFGISQTSIQEKLRDAAQNKLFFFLIQIDFDN